jgi:sulfatase modifying factor 1
MALQWVAGFIAVTLSACGARTGLRSDMGPSSSGGGPAPGGGSGSAKQPPSCVAGGPGQSDCASNKESCCTSPVVAAGTFYRTYMNDGTGPMGEADPATVSAFRFDKYDVTVGRFRQFVSAWRGGWRPAAGSGKHTHLNGGQGLVDVGAPGGGTAYEVGWVASDNDNVAPTDANLACVPKYATWTVSVGAQENLPIDCENWYEAYAYCIWDDGFLPTEAEWEYLAAAGTQQRQYPWGNAIPTTNPLQYANFGCFYPAGTGVCVDLTNIAPVGSFPLGAGLWGQLDLVGNVWQWTLDWVDQYVVPCVDCAYLRSGGSRVVGGSVFTGDTQSLLLSNRDGTIPSDRSYSTGVRCARAL